ncbi:MAG: 16S rRNA (cytosine(1402)-N(4))-methyltransferase RsmH, partial [Lachnospiraceae bacterium]|nr:16S rRNA (cytosine(1402)-N(4))-methyltransferase RsmH [Lachnospiraceae bacterium]
MEFNHYSVLLTETIRELNIRPDGLYMDGTLGGGGHSLEICRRLTGGHLYGIDQDDAAIEAAGERLREVSDKVTILRGNYCGARRMLEELGVTELDGIILDLGVSSYQLDTEERGFSYRFDAPLDMRMDRRSSLTARDIINGYSESELYRIIRDYGEDRFAKNIARHIVAARQRAPIETTFELNEIIKGAIPAKMRQDGHPSKQTFQALRIECNSELEVLRASLDGFID